MGNIPITVDPGLRPEIKVSKPIKVLFTTGGDVFWGFESEKLLAGPFKYGVIPDGAQGFIVSMSPDLVTGEIYTIQVDDGQDNVSVKSFKR